MFDDCENGRWRPWSARPHRIPDPMRLRTARPSAAIYRWQVRHAAGRPGSIGQTARLLLLRDCLLLKLRLSSSVSPPQTPWSTPDSKAHSRHGSLTGQPRQTSRASAICSIAGPVDPMGKKSSGSLWRQAASSRQLAPAPTEISLRGFGPAGPVAWAARRARANPAFERGAVVTGNLHWGRAGLEAGWLADDRWLRSLSLTAVLALPISLRADRAAHLRAAGWQGSRAIVLAPLLLASAILDHQGLPRPHHHRRGRWRAFRRHCASRRPRAQPLRMVPRTGRDCDARGLRRGCDVRARRSGGRTHLAPRALGHPARLLTHRARMYRRISALPTPWTVDEARRETGLQGLQ